VTIQKCRYCPSRPAGNRRADQPAPGDALKAVGGMWSTRGVEWAVPLNEVASVTALEPLPLTLALKDGATEEFFLVHEYADTEEKIRSAIATTE
jgi:hypothetical protein